MAVLPRRSTVVLAVVAATGFSLCSAVVVGQKPAGAWPGRDGRGGSDGYPAAPGDGSWWGGRRDQQAAPSSSAAPTPAPAPPPADQPPADQPPAQDGQTTAAPAPAPAPAPVPAPAPQGGGGSGAFWDAGAVPESSQALTVKVLNRTNGQYPDDQVFWSYGGQTHSIAEQSTVDLTVGDAQRMNFSLGSAGSPYTDFIEFTTQPDTIYANTTRVAGFGLKLAMRLRSHNGTEMTVGETEAVFGQSREATFQSFRDSVPAEFKHLADVQSPNRIVAPWQDAAFQPGGASADYFASTGYSTNDVVACAGPLANDPNRCAELNRGPGGGYQSAPANFYSKWTHDIAIDGKSYGFAYDDVGNSSSLISVGDPQYLLVAVGW
jgi:hypothetical protein